MTVLLMEGYQADWAVENVYETRSGLRIKRSQEGRLVSESGESLTLSPTGDFMHESQKRGSGEIVALEGVFQRAGVKNANGRVYMVETFRRILAESSDVINRMNAGGMVGHIEHPSDGVTDLKKVAIRVVGLKLREDGTVWGRCLVLGTGDGVHIAKLLEGGVRLGVSSRGRGSIRSDGTVNDDYCLETFDIVHNPSTPGAFPTRQNESVRTNESTTVPVEQSQESSMTFNPHAFKQAVAPLIEQDLSALPAYQVLDLRNRLEESLSSAAIAIKGDNAVGTVLGDLPKALSDKIAQIDAVPANESAKLRTRVAELEAKLEEATEALTAATKRAEAATSLAEAATKQFSARLHESRRALVDLTATLNEALAEDDEDDEDDLEESSEELLTQAVAEERMKNEAALDLIESLLAARTQQIPHVTTAKPTAPAVAESTTQSRQPATPRSDSPRGSNVSSEGGTGSSLNESSRPANAPTLSKGAAIAQSLFRK